MSAGLRKPLISLEPCLLMQEAQCVILPSAQKSEVRFFGWYKSLLLHGLYGSSDDFPVSPSTPSPTFKLTTIFVWEAADIFFQERGTYNIMLWFCLMYHPSCETIREHLLSVWPWCRFTVLLHNLPPCSLLHLLLTLLLRPGAGRDTVCFHLLLTSVKRGSAQHPAGSGLFPLPCG